MRVLASAALVAGAVSAAAETPRPLTDDDFFPVDRAEAELGQLLFYDPILSGNRNISCGTCHHPRFATGDGVSLGLGEGGIGLGPDRRPDPENLPEQLIPRNAPPLFNMGARDVTVMFHDGRIEVDTSRPSGLRTPLEDEMVTGFSGLLSAQTMFPVLSPDEMAGHYGENEISTAVRQGRLTGPDGAWGLIAGRVAGIDGYASRFASVYPEIADGRPVAFTDISNAIAAFIAFEWRADASPFDAYLRDGSPLPEAAERGRVLFYGDAGCAACHSGPFLSDHGFHAMGQPQLGPGKAERFETHQNDIGRARVTGRMEDTFAFRTPMLRNVAQTGPWGHAGAFSDLRAFLAHHLDPAAGIEAYVRQAVVPVLPETKPLWAVMEDPDQRGQIAQAAAPHSVQVPASALDDLVAFLESLTDPASLEGRLGVPDNVPSGLPIDR